MLYYYPKLIQNKSTLERYKVEVPLLHNSGVVIHVYILPFQIHCIPYSLEIS